MNKHLIEGEELAVLKAQAAQLASFKQGYLVEGQIEGYDETIVFLVGVSDRDEAINLFRQEVKTFATYESSLEIYIFQTIKISQALSEMLGTQFGV